MIKRNATRWCSTSSLPLITLAAITLLLTSSLGCKSIVNRAQSPDQPIPVEDKSAKTVVPDGPTYIGKTCRFWGTNYAPIEGLSIATGLDGTGSSPGPSPQREQLLKELSSRREVDNARKLLNSKNTEMILVRGMLPPGIRKGETFDLEVRTPRGATGTSIENGTAVQCRLRPLTRVGRSVKKGQLKGLAKGDIIVESAFSTRDDESTTLRGIIPGGGIAVADRDMGLSIKVDNLPARTSSEIAQAINNRFSIIERDGRQGAAEPKTDRVVNLRVPEEYRLNVGRYLHVLRNITYNETVQQRVNRLEELESKLASPATAELAAFRLEALGREGQPALKRALTHDDAEVRFHAAQALTYQNEADGVEILKLAARDEPAFRALALSALATIDATSATDALEDLLHVPSAETRYGAFHALLAKPSQTPVVAGKWVGDSFFLHPIKSKTDAMLHFSRANRAEIVIFNDQQTVSEDFLHVSAGLTVKAVGNDKIRITHFRPDGSDSKTTCSTRVADLIEQLVERGFEYSDLLKMFRKARQNGTLNSRLVVNAMPRSDREYVPGENSLELPPERSDKYMAKAAPTLFNNGEGSSTTSAAVDETEETPSAKKTSEPIRDSLVRPASHWGKLLPFKKNAAKRGKP